DRDGGDVVGGQVGGGPFELVRVERGDEPPVELVAAVAHVHDRPDGVDQLRRPRGRGRQRRGGGQGEPYHSGTGEPAAGDESGGEVGGAALDGGGAALVEAAVLQQGRQRGDDAAGDVGRGGGLDGGGHVHVVVEQDGVGVGAAHVDAYAHSGVLLAGCPGHDVAGRAAPVRPSLPATAYRTKADSRALSAGMPAVTKCPISAA